MASPKTKNKITHSRKSPAKSTKTQSSNKYSDIAHQYARDVVSGKVVACKWVRLACQRHIDDQERSKTAAFPYEYLPKKAELACKFIEALPHTKDDFERRASSGERFKLEPWQIFLVCSLFGWVDKKSLRYRFREAYIEVPRKNGKSFLAAGIGLFKFSADGEFGAEVYSGATTEKQAWEIFRPARDIALRTPALKEAFGITVNAKSLTILKNGSRFEPVIGKPGDGASPSCALVDEFHEHPTDELVETMRNGMGARKSPLLFQITTAGSDRSSPCYSRHLDVKKLLSKEGFDNERLFGIIYTIDDGDDWTSPEAAKKANPNYGVSVDPEGLMADLDAAKQSASLQNSYKTKRENIWQNAAVGWMNMVLWKECVDPSLRADDFAGQEAWMGIDLAAKIDIASRVKVFRKIIDNDCHYYAFHDAYLNERAVDNSKNGSYRKWSIENRLHITEGDETDYFRIATDIINDAKKFSIRELPHDKRDAQSIIQFIKADPNWDQSAEFVEIEQSKNSYTPAMRELEAAVAAKRFHYDGDPVLEWMIANVVVRPDPLDLLFPRKQRDEDKIDGAVALLMAINRAMVAPPPMNASDMFMVL